MKPVTLTGLLELKAANDDKLARRFFGIAYSGGFVPGYHIVVDLDSVRLADDMPLLDAHANKNHAVIGAITETRIEGGKLEVGGDFFSDIDPVAEMIARKVKRGAKYQMSIGIHDANEEFISPGKSVTVNGQEFAGPITILRDAHIREVSVVPLGADANTRATFFKTPEGKQVELEALRKQNTELSAKVAELTTDRDGLRKELEAARKELDEIKRKAREEKVKALFSAIGVEYTDEAASPYLEMSSKAFEAVSAHMKAAKPKGADNLSEEMLAGDEDASSGASAGGYLLAAVKQSCGIE